MKGHLKLSDVSKDTETKEVRWLECGSVQRYKGKKRETVRNQSQETLKCCYRLRFYMLDKREVLTFPQ